MIIVGIAVGIGGVMRKARLNSRVRYKIWVTMIVAGALVLLASGWAAAGASAATLTLAADPAAIAAGSTTALTATIDVADAALQLEQQDPSGSGFSAVGGPVTASATASAWQAQWQVSPPRTTTYRVSYTDPVSNATDTATVTVAVHPSLTISAAPATVYYGYKSRLTIRSGLPLTQLTLRAKVGGAADFGAPTTITTDAAGSFIRSITMRRNTVYRVDYAGDSASGWSPVSAEATVAVKPRVFFTISPTATYEGWRVRFSGSTSANLAGRQVVIERRYSDGWKPWRTRTLSSTSRYSYNWASSGRGTLAFRVRIAASASFAESISTTRGVYLRNPNPYGVPRSQPRYIVVDKSQFKLYYHEYGKVKRIFPCVLGKSSTPTPLGRYRIYAKDPVMGGPYGPRRMRYRGLFAIHGTNEPWLLSRFPRAYSHGCTRLSNSNILWLYARCRVGTPVWNVP